MRLAPLALLLAACSSPATTTTTHPGDDVYVTLDAAPTPVAVVTPDADPGPCLGADNILDSMHGDSVRVCRELVGNACYDVLSDGTFEIVQASIEAQNVGPYADYADGKIEVCADQVCKKLTPKLGKGQKISRVEPSERGDRLAAVYQDQALAAGTIEVWDVAAGKPLARMDFKRADRAGTRYISELVGDDVLVYAVLPDGDVEGSLWRVAKKKLVKIADLAGDVLDAERIDDARGAFTLDRRLVIVDLASGQELREIDWSPLIPAGDDPAIADYVFAVDGDQIALTTYASEDGPLRAVGIATLDGKVTPYPVRICTTASEED